MTLYKVYVDTCLIVEAPDSANDFDIYFAAQRAVGEHLSETDIHIEELESVKDLPAPWTAECLPYSTEYNTEDKTIGQILGDK